ncbi:MAG: 30S ribosomal protein S9 [Elusimicrobia bacterium RIFOXYC2_FULL_34_12]|nr:MAG: 30S ribosomal protein S9 [Elusimicrobia bacterium RIFOXYC2_FULL_34_12]OGS38011.1 MAG: 30S ribosomal protein S9 [Elusimicrobia bacterium RIFOXYD2_FULL_34_30]HAM38691.1 30S ribosomal protein S9 [Elusimicrobiota bacterium]
MSKDKSNLIIATGRRKTSAAKVILTLGQGKVIVNGKPLDKYFAGLPRFQTEAIVPLNVANIMSQYNISVSVTGGGVMSQAEAIRHGIARALSTIDGNLKGIMKKESFLTRDDRMVERKKPGRAKARKSFQWTKR